MKPDLSFVVTCHRDGWRWHIKEQDDGVVLVYEENSDAPDAHTSLGSVEDAESLRDALSVYLEMVERHEA